MLLLFLNERGGSRSFLPLLRQVGSNKNIQLSKSDNVSFWTFALPDFKAGVCVCVLWETREALCDADH